jgi:uncharacterized membrane protein HdeD (DUF308 family)
LLTLLALVVLLGVFWVVNGAIELFTALSHREMPGRGWTAATGVLSILAGIIVLIYPGPSLLTLSIVLGIWLLAYGVMEIMAAFRLRGLAHARRARRKRPGRVKRSIRAHRSPRQGTATR